MWLIEFETAEKMRSAFENTDFSGTDSATIEAAYKNKRKNLSRKGATATIYVEGVLTKEPDIISMIFGGANTTYQSLQEDIISASDDERIENIEILIDSPGGEVDGLFETIEYLQISDKPVTAIVTGKACSAAYAIACAADKIEAASPYARFGSIGVAQSFYVENNVITLSSTAAPDKRPDPTTEAGQSVIRAQLDEIHSIFAENVAKGRKTTVENVNKNFGKGSTFLAREAMNRGMIDKIEGIRKMNTSHLSNAQKTGSNEEMKDSRNNEFNEGIESERKRCLHLMSMARTAGNIESAMPYIESGAAIDAKVFEAFMSIKNKNLIAASMSEEDEEVSSTASDLESPLIQRLKQKYNKK